MRNVIYPAITLSLSLLIQTSFAQSMSEQARGKLPTASETAEFLNAVTNADDHAKRLAVGNSAFFAADGKFARDQYGYTDISKLGEVTLTRYASSSPDEPVKYTVRAFCRVPCKYSNRDKETTMGNSNGAETVVRVFVSSDSAERYAKALRHLISLQSGRKQMF